MRGAEPAALTGFEREPATDKLVDLDLDAEQSLQEPLQPRCALRPWRDEPSEAQLRHIRYGIAIGEHARAQSGKGADIGDEAVLRRPVMLSNRPGVGPGAKEQLQEASVQKIEKTREGIIPHQPPAETFIGDGKRQRALRSQQAQKFHQYPEPAVVFLDGSEVGGGKLQIRGLAELDILLASRGAITDPRSLRIGALQLAQRIEEIEAPGLSLHLVDQFHSGLRVPMRGGHRMTSP